MFFEEWNDPLISGVQWVEELIEIACGQTIFPELRLARRAKERVAPTEQIIEHNPDVIIAPGVGKVNKEAIVPSCRGRVSAIRHGQCEEILSSHIIQPGPRCLTDGVCELHRILAQAAGDKGSENLRGASCWLAGRF